MPSPPTNSLLNLLNPYASVTASQAPRRHSARDDSDSHDDQSVDGDVDSRPSFAPPESPSALLLRELQFQSGDSAASVASNRTPAAMIRERSQSQEQRGSHSPPTSPTPTSRPQTSKQGQGHRKARPSPMPQQRSYSAATSTSGASTNSSTVAPVRPSHILADSSSEDDGPPQSLMFDDGGGNTPRNRSPISGLPTSGGGAIGLAGLGLTAPKTKWKDTSRSPGPFRRRPSSTSSSTQSPTSPLPRVLDVDPLVSSNVYAAPSTSTESESQSHSPRSVSTSTESELPTARPPWSEPVNKGKEVPRVSVDDGRRGRAMSSGDATSPATTSRTRRHGKQKHKYQSVPTTEVTRLDSDSGGPDVRRAKIGLSGYNKALWKWVNVTDLDRFLQYVYEFYEEKGFWCIALSRALKLLTTFFVIGFTTFLTSCIDYSKLRHSGSSGTNGKLEDALVPKCLTRGSYWHMMFLVLVCIVYVFQLGLFIRRIPGLIDMYQFYTYLLGVPDADIQTMPWPEAVRLIGDIKKHNPVTSFSNRGPLAEFSRENGTTSEGAKLDAHDIANRIMRKENYLIALFNKDLLDLRVRFPLPKAVEHLVPPAMVTAPSAGIPRSQGDEDRSYLTFGGSSLTKALEWNLRWCLQAILFDATTGQVKMDVMRDRNRKQLVQRLRHMFIFMGLLNAILAPFIVIYVLIYSFFRYFEEYHKNPSSIGSRKYTLYARWKFREFNELPHLFDQRLNQSYPVAKEYIDQFPKARTSLVMRFVAFIAGSFAAVLLVASALDPDLFLHFEVTPHRTVLFYLGVFGTILAVARGMIPEENSVFDPEYLMRELVRYTHYLPSEWKGKLHSQKVHQDFGQLFQMKVAIFAQELVSVLLTPFILWFSLPNCSEAIIDFFREFTIHVEGLGYVCSFAVFDFHRPGAVGPEGAAAAAAAATTDGAPPSPTIRRRYGAGGLAPGHGPTFRNQPSAGMFYDSNNKMEQSFLHFKAAHPDWQPTDPSASVFLDKLINDNATAHANAAATSGPQARMHSSLYGNRGLGLSLGARPPALSPGLQPPQSAGPGSRWFQPAELTTQEEEEIEAEDDEAEAMGWNHHMDAEGSVEHESEHDDRGLLRGAGMILNQVMNR